MHMLYAVIGVAMCLFGHGECLLCHKCEYNELRSGDEVIFTEGPENCLRDPDNSAVYDCIGTCVKHDVSYSDITGNYKGNIVSRGCELGCAEGTVSGGDEEGQAEVTTYCCATDKCNAAATPRVQYLCLVCALFVVIYSVCVCKF